MIIVRRPWLQQPPGIPRFSERFASRVAFLQVGGSIYDGQRWSRFTQTAQQVITSGRFGQGIRTTADSTPAAYSSVGAAQIDQCGIVVVARKNAVSNYDSVFGVKSSTNELFVVGTSDYSENEVSLYSPYSSYLFDPGGPSKLPESGALVWRNDYAGGVGDVHTDGRLSASGTVTGALPITITAAAVGGRIGESNRNWRGTNILSAVIKSLGKAEAREISANPWATLFQSRRIFVPVAASGASTYTLSAATYAPGSITATGVTPRVSVTVA